MPVNIFVQDLKKSGSGFDLTDVNGALGDALKYLYSNREAFCSIIGENENKSLKYEALEELRHYEGQAKTTGRSWRFVLDFSIDKEGKHRHSIVQFCSGAPDHNRYIIEFDAKSVDSRMATKCVEAHPDMTTISGGVTEEQRERNMTLARAKKYYDKDEMQRIAILGAAIVFPYESNNDEEERKLAISQTSRVQTELNKLLDYMNQRMARKVPYSKYAFVNGGWAGIQEDSIGIPMISHLFGVVHSKEQEKSSHPITVMPIKGNYDRVKTIADHIEENRRLGFGAFTEKEIDTATATYFEVPGIWGDDSKYLAGISTSLIIFDPHGAWTDIEIANGVAQGKPVAIIPDPEGFAKGWYSDFKEVDGGQYRERLDGVRLYNDIKKAVEWMSQEWQKKVLQEKSAAGLTYEEQNRPNRGRRHFQDRQTWMGPGVEQSPEQSVDKSEELLDKSLRIE